MCARQACVANLRPAPLGRIIYPPYIVYILVCQVESVVKTHFIKALHSYVFPSINSVMAQTADFRVRQLSCATLQCHRSVFLGAAVTQQSELEVIFISACGTMRGEQVY